jgi:hypothetical protein
MSKAAALKEPQKIPGVGKCIAGDLWDLNIRSEQDLNGKNPENLYLRLYTYKNKMERCQSSSPLSCSRIKELMSWNCWSDAACDNGILGET